VTAEPIQQSWTGWWGWWQGPHASQAWPLAGAFPDALPSDPGQFTAVSGLSGNWSRPFQEYNQVTAVGVPVTWSTDSTISSLSTPYPPTWQSRNPITPILRLTDDSSLADLQDWIVIFAVAFGISGSILASLLFEGLRRPPDQENAPADGSSQPSTQARNCPHPRQAGYGDGGAIPGFGSL
jgi:hypothetical protein